METAPSFNNLPIPALIPESEMVGDDWLIEDVRCRKQKLSNIESVYRTGNDHWSENRCTKRKTAEQDQRSLKKQRRQISDRTSVEEDSVSDSGDRCSYSSLLNPGLTEVLADVSISKASVSGPLFVPTNSPCTAAEPTQEELIQPSSNAPMLKLRLKVRIENNLIVVPVPQK